MAPLDVYIVTFNCGRLPVNSEHFSQSFFAGRPDKSAFPDVVVIYLEEIAPIPYAFLGGWFLSAYFKALLQAVKLATRDKQSYRHVISRNVGMTGIVLFAKSEVADRIRWLETAGVGVGHWEMGNKGAVGVRVGLQPDGQDDVSEITFVAAHLAPMEDAVERRNKDWEDIVRGLAFTSSTTSRPSSPSESTPLLSSSASSSSSSSQPRSLIVPQTPLFFGGDLNYRTSSTSPSSKDDLKFYPQPSIPSNTDALRARDQLTPERTAHRTLHSLTEAPLHFAPTYKYMANKQYILDRQPAAVPTALGAGLPNLPAEPKRYHWANHRWPSWPDRVLFSDWLEGNTSPLKIQAYEALPLTRTSDHRPVALSVSLTLPLPAAALAAARAVEPPFPLNADWKARRAAARRRELLVGTGAWVITTWEGTGLIMIGLLGWAGWWMLIGRGMEVLGNVILWLDDVVQY